jgi:enoyl-CoA hydratase/3-hydroxyacyl-CoA dehydrogenase
MGDHQELIDRFTAAALLEEIRLIEEGIVSPRDADVAMLAGAGLQPPPLARADREGLDVVLERVERLHEKFGEEFAPPAMLRRLVAAGHLGVKTGKGFFEYETAKPGDPYETLTVERIEESKAALVTINRPPANAISPTVIAEFEKVLDEIAGDRSVRSVIVTGAGTNIFMAGADIMQFFAGGGNPQEELLKGQRLYNRIERFEKPVIAAVNGVALGGGCEFAMACDIRLAADSASFGLPEINLGIIPGWGGTQRLTRLVGRSQAMRMLMTGDPIRAERAVEIGLATEVVPLTELRTRALNLARRLAEKPPLAIAAIKRVAGWDESLTPGLQQEAEAIGQVMTSKDAMEGVQAFMQKRKPAFTGE